MRRIELSLLPYADNSGNRFEITCTDEPDRALIIVKQGSDMLAVATLEHWEALRAGVDASIDALRALKEGSI